MGCVILGGMGDGAFMGEGRRGEGCDVDSFPRRWGKVGSVRGTGEGTWEGRYEARRLVAQQVTVA